MDLYSTHQDLAFYYCLSNNYLRQGGGDRENNLNLGLSLLKTPATTGEWLGGDGSRSSLVNSTFPSLTLDGLTYYGVYVIYEQDWNINDPTGQNIVNIYYIAPDIGLVRKEANVHTANPEIWNLIRHQVNQ